MPADIDGIGDGAARFAYRCGADPLTHAEGRVATLIAVNLQVIGARFSDPAAFPIYSQDTSIPALSRRILGLMLDIGWTPPDVSPASSAEPPVPPERG